MAKHKYKGITFDSKNEMKAYKELEKCDVFDIIDHHKEFLMYDNFSYYCPKKMKQRKLRKMRYTPDFIITTPLLDKPIAVEYKGYGRNDYKMRKKLFIINFSDKYYFVELGSLKETKEFIKQHREKLIQVAYDTLLEDIAPEVLEGISDAELIDLYIERK